MRIKWSSSQGKGEGSKNWLWPALLILSLEQRGTLHLEEGPSFQAHGCLLAVAHTELNILLVFYWVFFKIHIFHVF